MSVFPDNEKERLARLKKLEILDSDSETAFDSIVKLASAICGVPIALISLLDEERQWFKAKLGVNVESTDRSISFCQYAILDEKVFEVENALENEIFANNPLVTNDPSIRFYAGAPLKDENGLNLGTLCVIDNKPKKLTSEQKDALEILASEVVELIQLRKKNIELEQHKSEIEGILYGLQEGFVYQDTEGAILKCNQNAEEILGLTYDQMIGKKSVDPSWRAIHEDGSDFPGETHPAMVSLRTKKPLSDVIMGVHKPNDEITWISINAVPIFESTKNTILKGVICTFKDITKNKKIQDDLLKIQEHDFISKIVAKTKDVIVITDVEGKTIWVNNAFEKLTGYTIKDIFGKKPSHLLQGENTSIESVNKIREGIKNKSVVDVNIVNYSKTGKEYVLNINLSPIFKEGSKTEVEYYIAIERDVTELMKINEEKEKQHENLINSQKIAKIGNWSFDVLTNQMDWSDELYSIFEIDKITIDKNNLYAEYLNKIHPNDLNLLNTKITEAIKNGIGYKIGHRITTSKGIKHVAGTSEVVKDSKNNVISLKGTLQDITELKLRDLEIKNYDERWRFAIENTGDGIWDYDLVKNVAWQSDQLLRNLGYSQNEFAGNHQDFLNLIHPDDQQKVDEHFKAHLKGETDQFVLEYRVKNKTGGYNWILDRAKITERNENSEPIRMIGVHQDQTERKREDFLKHIISELSAKALSEKNNKKFHNQILSQLLEITNSEYGFIGEVFQDEQKNPYLKTYAITNISWDEETRNFYNLHAPNGMEFRNLETLFGYTLKNNELVISNDPSNDTRRGGLPKGHPDLNAYLGIPVIHDSKLIGMIGVANKENGYNQKDFEFIKPFISTFSNVVNSVKIDREREKNQAEILSVKTELEKFFELTNDVMVIANIDGTFRKVNKEICTLLGYKKEELEGKAFIDLIHKDDLSATFQEIEKLEQGHTTINFENRYRKSNGEYVILSWKSSPDPLTGMLYATARDVTKDKIYQTELIQEKKKAELASHAKSEFLANMSHEIRTPLNGVIGFSRLLNETELNDNQKLFSSTILKSSEILLNIINDILDFSKIEAGKTEIDIQKLDIHEFIYDVIDVITFQAQEKDLDVLIDIDTKISTHLYIDETHLKQILVNLLSNAIKFTPKGEIKLSIDLKNEVNENKSILEFRIADTGIGIAKESLNRIFEIFSQADTSTTRKFGGTGLGLNISNSLIKLMGGDQLYVESELGKGSDFYFELELDHEKFEAKTPEYKTTKRLLLANKSRNESEIIRKILSQENIDVTLTENCEETKNVFINDTKNFDLVLVDSKLYNKKNNENLKNLVELEKFDLTKTNIGIITRSIHDNTYFDDCKKYGVNSKAIKPIKPNHFKETIFGVLNQKNQHSSILDSNQQKRLRILIAEDNSINKLLVKTIIESFNLNTRLIIVSNGKEAVEEFSKFNPHLILMDLIMPEMNGIEATKQIKQIKGNNNFKIFALTAGENDDDFVQKEMNGFLEKPIDSEKLKKIIEDCLIDIQNN